MSLSPDQIDKLYELRAALAAELLRRLRADTVDSETLGLAVDFCIAMGIRAMPDTESSMH
jgi:hypothetical protein